MPTALSHPEDRTDLAAALRWAERLGLNEGIDNHFSCAVSPDGHRFLVNPLGFHWRELRASDLVLASADRTILEGTNQVEDTAFFIHSRLHLNHPRARAVLHTHMPYATALTIMEHGRLEMVSQNALQFYGRIAYLDDYEGLALDHSEGDRMAAAMGDKTVLFLGHHGVIVTGPTIHAAWNDLYFLERACMVQVLAMSTGRPLRPIPERVMAEMVRAMNTNPDAVDQPRKHLEALKRILGREAPDFRD
ncbi:MAG: aldolase [Gemmatimonadales bacterium]|nr:aldolase [Gemmatimonadales bacterium]